MSLQAEKQQYRTLAKTIRATLPVADISAQVTQHLQYWDVYQQARHILSYLAFGGEISLDALHQDRQKTFYVTRTHKTHLSVHAMENLEPHPFGYWQPPAHAENIPANQIDLVLVPGLCFDRYGFRMGYGKGYYDKLLPAFKQVPLVGITAEALIFDRLPTEHFDVPMTHVVSESGIKSIKAA